LRSLWFLALFALLYVAVVAPHFSEAYLDFGDGNYLYISSRLADGLVLYRDILAPQPPCHLLVGSVLIRLGRALGQGIEVQLYCVRAFSLLLHLATMLVVWAMGRRLFARASTALWAAALYLVIPVGFWWTLCYESESLEIFFLLLSFLLVVRWEKRALAAAGLVGALAIATNMTAVPYIGWVALFLLWHDRRRAIWYIAPAAALTAAVVGAGEWLSGGHYLENVFFNQVGTFPHPDLMRGLPPDAPFRTLRTIVGYAFGKMAREGSDVLAHDGLFISAAIAGLLIYLGKKENDEPTLTRPLAPTDEASPSTRSLSSLPSLPSLRTPCSQAVPPPGPPVYHRSFVGWYAFWSFLAIGFVAKRATEDYIFTIGEPFVCLFAALAISEIGDRAFGKKKYEERSTKCESEKAAERGRGQIMTVAIVALGLVVLFAHPAQWIYRVVHEQRAYELNAAGAQRIRFLIEEHSRPGEAILAAPYYAFLAHRPLIEEHSEMFIWHIKYLLEQRVERREGPATRKVNAIAAALRQKAVPVVVIEMDKGTLAPRQVFSIPPVNDALRQNYQPLLTEPIEGLNEMINVLAPK